MRVTRDWQFCWYTWKSLNFEDPRGSECVERYNQFAGHTRKCSIARVITRIVRRRHLFLDRSRQLCDLPRYSCALSHTRVYTYTCAIAHEETEYFGVRMNIYNLYIPHLVTRSPSYFHTRVASFSLFHTLGVTWKLSESPHRIRYHKYYIPFKTNTYMHVYSYTQTRRRSTSRESYSRYIVKRNPYSDMRTRVLYELKRKIIRHTQVYFVYTDLLIIQL